MAHPPTDPAFFKEFATHDVIYKTVDNHDIQLSVLIPKALLSQTAIPQKKRPVIVHFHGGFLIAGTRTYSDWFATWLVELALSRGAILVTPDYRLLPESTGRDILSDLNDFWSWIKIDLASNVSTVHPSSTIQPDLDKVMVMGGSAGGYLAAQSMLLHPEIHPSAVVLVYPMVHLRDRFWNEKYEKPMYGTTLLPYEPVEEHLRNLPDGAIVSNDKDLDKGLGSSRSEMALRIVQNGRFLDFLGTDSNLFPLENISRATTMPPFVWIYHGRQDSAVPYYGSERFVEELRRHKPDVKVRFEGHDGDHGFDAGLTISEGWMKDSIAELSQYW
ncbi:hypothetical protein N7539_000201 [Penicillium diatomitis]|uniref:Alpha/beta hydrolase fold-3 domain-containing protein n=1 Tax=Penicillium diatomitis TaxID=2819901 RepID=A0A9X0C2F1_9EURO|nr:uncharacterized protein N7539_000201 [Penicillium diatomitis]KAJ5495085.1 hypothetical protein N7539_000201 [Penicillium diatomitis]